VGLRAGLDDVERGKFLPPNGNRTLTTRSSSPWPVAIPNTLFVQILNCRIIKMTPTSNVRPEMFMLVCHSTDVLNTCQVCSRLGCLRSCHLVVSGCSYAVSFSLLMQRIAYVFKHTTARA
jgi:hypothetical protein